MKQTPLEINYEKGTHRAWEAALHATMVQRWKEGKTLSGAERKQIVDNYCRQNVKHADAIVPCQACRNYADQEVPDNPLRALRPEEVRAIGQQLGISIRVRNRT